jgi:hypothetical protein
MVKIVVSMVKYILNPNKQLTGTSNVSCMYLQCVKDWTEEYGLYFDNYLNLCSLFYSTYI